MPYTTEHDIWKSEGQIKTFTSIFFLSFIHSFIHLSIYCWVFKAQLDFDLKVSHKEFDKRFFVVVVEILKNGSHLFTHKKSILCTSTGLVFHDK